MILKNQQKRDLGLLILRSKLGDRSFTRRQLSSLFSSKEIKLLIEEDFLSIEFTSGLERFRVKND